MRTDLSHASCLACCLQSSRPTVKGRLVHTRPRSALGRHLISGPQGLPRCACEWVTSCQMTDLAGCRGHAACDVMDQRSPVGAEAMDQQNVVSLVGGLFTAL